MPKKPEFRKLAKEIFFAVCATDWSADIMHKELTDTIRREEKQHRKSREGGYRPICWAVDYFVVAIFARALRAFESDKPLAPDSFDMRTDHLLGYRFVARYREQLEPLKAQIYAVNDAMDYMVDIVIDEAEKTPAEYIDNFNDLLNAAR